MAGLNGVEGEILITGSCLDMHGCCVYSSLYLQLASSGVLEVMHSQVTLDALATTVMAFLKNSHGRNVIIATKDNEIIHADGLTEKESEPILKEARNIAAIDPG